jgi:hypothetical protein
VIRREHKYYLNLGEQRPDGFDEIMVSGEHIAVFKGKNQDGRYIFDEDGDELLVNPKTILNISEM